MLGWRDERPLTEVLPASLAKKFTKSFGYTTCADLIEHFPRTWVHHNNDVGLGTAMEGDAVTITGIVTRTKRRETSRGPIFKVTVDGTVEVTFFRAHWQHAVIREGARVMFSGKLKFFRGQPQLQHPDFLVLREPPFYRGNRPENASPSMKVMRKLVDVRKLLDNDWLPVYPATAGLTSWVIMAAIQAVLASLPPIPEPLDFRMMMSLDKAIREVHMPGPAGPERAIWRLKYNEALGVGLVMALRRRTTRDREAYPLPLRDDAARAALLDSLPFELTAGQRNVAGEIAQDVASATPMSRLLQGEVGSGKTLVALLAMLQAVDNGKQAALLAPTEVLAAQHATSIASQVPDGVKVVLLTGSMKVAEKKQALLDVVTGEADIVIGTHALIQDSVEFFDLAMVVVDEQHRFGVEQRDQLRGKARGSAVPHVLVMTATPIPRTIAMTVFGDLAVSTLDELPGGRKPIQSAVAPDWKPGWIERAWTRVREEVQAGHQAYVVCPRIEGDGGVWDVYDYLRRGPLRGLRLCILHGKLHDKDEIMAMFARGEIDVLVSTTVVEVGVDVPNATVMVIRESEVFGVSQLHQLRGRVGRGGNASLCLFHTTAEKDSAAFERIEAVAKTSIGFELAELDLQQRQEGDVLGTSQSGVHRTLRLLNLTRDLQFIERANADAFALVERDPALAAQLVSDIPEIEKEFLDKS